jgi:uncharacterized protein DUF5343
MLTDRYLQSAKNVPQVFEQMIKGTAPQVFNSEYLSSVGFASSNDRAFPPLLKALGFLDDSGRPTPRYHSYRAGGDEAKAVLGEALLEAYEELFHVNANPTERDRPAIEGKFKSTHNATDRVAEQQAITFFALLKIADIEAARKRKGTLPPQLKKEVTPIDDDDRGRQRGPDKRPQLDLRYQIEVHLPATKDIDVYHAIFKSLRENLLD